MITRPEAPFVRIWRASRVSADELAHSGRTEREGIVASCRRIVKSQTTYLPYQRKSQWPAKAPVATMIIVASGYQLATNSGESSGQLAA